MTSYGLSFFQKYVQKILNYSYEYELQGYRSNKILNSTTLQLLFLNHHESEESDESWKFMITSYRYFAEYVKKGQLKSKFIEFLTDMIKTIKRNEYRECQCQ